MRYLPCFLCVYVLCATSVGCFRGLDFDFETACTGVNCGDGNPCTRDFCANFIDFFNTGVSGPKCQHEPTNDGQECGFEEVALTCRDGLCGGEHLCEGVLCEDDDLCTNDACAWDGECVFPPVACEDDDLCTEDRCGPDTGLCDFTTPAEDGTLCFADMDRWEAGGCEAGVCVGPCDPESQEELECPVEFVFTLTCCPGRENCLPQCSLEF